MRGFILGFFLSFSTFTNAEPLVIGTLPYYPPFEVAGFKNTHFFGFDIDIMTEICRRIGGDCRFIPLSFEELFKQVLAGQIDLAIGAISITKTREQTVSFSLPYLNSNGQYISLSKSPIKSLMDLKGKKIGVMQGTLFKVLILMNFQDQVDVLEYANFLQMFQALTQEKVDAIITDEASASHWVAINSSSLKLIGEPMPLGVGYGIMANKNASGLIDRINKALLEMEEDGSYLNIYHRYFDLRSPPK